MTETVPPDIGRERSDPKSAPLTGGFFPAGSSAAAHLGAANQLKQSASSPVTFSARHDAVSQIQASAGHSFDEKQGSVLDKSTTNDSSSTPPIPVDADGQPPKQPWFKRVVVETKKAFWLTITHSWVNVLLVTVPIGIVIANVPGIHPGAVFGVNAIAIIPLAGLLSHATESVAREMGDALGALLNVTFGNAVELIIFIIALTKNQIRIVQASLLGSILANLLLILGMGFFLGGLRYREQVYNSTVTQMSACLLSLSVISLVLPTAFHASFKDDAKADEQSLKISRGTSVILLLVYAIYLLFQLKSHAYLYESTPQHIVDAEAIPGPAAGWLDSSTSDSSSSSSSDTDSSHDTMRKRMKKVLRAGRRRKGSVGSSTDNNTRASSFTTAATISPRLEGNPDNATSSRPSFFPRLPSGEAEEEVIEEEKQEKLSKKQRRRQKKEKRKARRNRRGDDEDEPTPDAVVDETAPRCVDFAMQNDATAVGHEADDEGEGNVTTKRPAFAALRGMSVRNLAPPVFAQKPEDDAVADILPPGPVPRVRYGIRRTNSLPDRLNAPAAIRGPGGFFPTHVSSHALGNGLNASAEDGDEPEQHLSQTAAVILLLITTGLVAACAEFLVGSIDAVVKTSSINEVFIGLIILPIVGNAAEHVTAITVAMKNKMDLAIGVALGSSIQIAIFVTPFVVVLGWIINREMTLYFTLFETVCLFVSAFIVNFLVLDGRSNYLEGALLCAVYIIIAILAFFYPDPDDASSWGN